MKTLQDLEQEIINIIDGETVQDIVQDNLYLLQGINDGQSFIDNIQERIQEQEIIYHSRAMQYLMDNDASLQYSLGLAHEYGYTCDQLNSETLATILYQNDLQNNLNHIADEIIDAIDDYIAEQNEIDE